MNPILITVIILTAIGLLVAAILFLVASKFKVEEDARIDKVEALLPGANCGGCGCAGCRDFATKLVAMEDLGDALCPVGGSDTMSKIAALLGKSAVAQAPRVAVVRCNGSCENRPLTSNYEGYKSCKVKASLYSGDTACRFGCLGCGDCTAVCKFDAIKMDAATGLPVVDEAKCTGCGACTKACPKAIIELRPKGPRGLKVVVKCSSKDKGAVARKACKAACIGCAKCQKVCPHDAIVVEDNLAYIDAAKCKLCAKCVDECPTGAIHKLNFPVKKAAPAAVPVVGKETDEPSGTPKPPKVSREAKAPAAAQPAGRKPREPKVTVEEAPESRPVPKSAASFKVVPKQEKSIETVKETPRVEKPAEPVKEAPKAEKPVEPVKEAPKEEKPAEPLKEAPKVAAPMEVEFPVEKSEESAAPVAAAAPAPKKRAPRKPKAAPKAEDREEVIDLDLFSGGVS